MLMFPDVISGVNKVSVIRKGDLQTYTPKILSKEAKQGEKKHIK